MPEAVSEKLLLDAKEAAALCGIGRSYWLRLHSSGRVPLPLRLGRRTLWSRAEVTRWVDAGLPDRQRWEELKNSEKRS
jgi:predicted DNA-binding transcriptional regulator AlpA